MVIVGPATVMILVTRNGLRTSRVVMITEEPSSRQSNGDIRVSPL
jgi:hypothetical protein